MNAIKCGQCGHENDLTRVFCQNCGTRLERGDVAVRSAGTTPVAVKRSKAKPRGLTPGAALMQALKGLLFTAALAAVAALFIQFSRAPDGLPPAEMVDNIKASNLFAAVQAFSAASSPRTLDLKESQINNYLASRVSVVRAIGTGGADSSAQVGRTFVALGEGSIRFYVERQHLGLSFYVYVDGVPVTGPEGASMTIKGGGVGRVPLDPRIMNIVRGQVITPVIDALAEPLQIFRKADRVTVKPGTVRVGWPGTAPTR